MFRKATLLINRHLAALLLIIFAAVFLYMLIHYANPGEALLCVRMAAVIFAFLTPLVLVFKYRKRLPMLWLIGPAAFIIFLFGFELGFRSGPYNYRFHKGGKGHISHLYLFWIDRWPKSADNWTEQQVKQASLSPDHPPVLFRSGPAKYEKPEGIFRVITMGGSNAYGYGVFDYRNTFTAQLESKVKTKYPERKFEFIAGTVNGYTTFQNLVLYRMYLKHYRPDLVIIYCNYNDSGLGLGPYSQHDLFKKQTGIDIEDFNPEKIPKDQAGTFFWKTQESLKHYRTYNVLSHVIITARKNIQGESSFFTPVISMADHKSNFKLLARSVGEGGGKLILADLARYLDPESSGVDHETMTMRRNMADVAGKDHVYYLPAHDLMHTRMNQEDFFFPDDVIHINETGHAMLADLLFELIEDQKIVAE